MASETPPDPVTRRRAVLTDLLVREAELVDLSTALDEPVARETDFKLAILALAQRARIWFRGFIALQDSPVPAAGLPLLRLAAEINILIRFLEMDPALHTELWQAEGERLSLATIEEHNAKHVERWGAIPIDPAEIDERRSTVREARAKAVAAEIIGEASTSVLPSTARQVKLIHHRAAYEAYTLVYRPMGFEIHSSAPSLYHGAFEVRNDLSVSFSMDRTAEEMVGARLQSLSIFASTLELASPHLRLTISAEADRIRKVYVPDEIPPEGRIDYPGRSEAADLADKM